MKTDTKLTQLGRKPSNSPMTVNLPTHRASTVLFDSVAHLNETQQCFNNGEPIPTYGIVNMPQVLALEDAVAEIEHGYRAMSFPSGLAAVAGALLASVKTGDHVLMPDSVYLPSRHFCDTFLPRLGVETSYYDPQIGGNIRSHLRPNTTVVYAESPGSHTFEVQDLPAIAEVARAHHAKVIFDNAWATGLHFDAFKHGADLVVQPATKYYAGHSDVLIGLVVANEESWPQLKQTTCDLGQRASPDDCFLTLRGLRTMGVRLARHQSSAIKIATWLQAQPQVNRVLYPALPSDPGHALWQRDFTGAAGLFSIELNPCSNNAVAAMIDGLQYFGLGYSWGGFESLVVPAYLHRSIKPWQGGPLVRLQIGLEDADDLIDDLRSGLVRLKNASG